MRTPRNLVSVTCLITVFCKTCGKSTFAFIFLGWKNIKLVFHKFKVKFFAFCYIDIFVSSLVTMEKKWLGFLREQKILVSSGNSRASQARDSWLIVNIHNEEERPKNWTLWNTTCDFPLVGYRGAKLHKLSPVFKITFNPIQSNVSNTIVLQIFTEYFMMSAIKRFRRVQKALKLLHFHQ